MSNNKYVGIIFLIIRLAGFLLWILGADYFFSIRDDSFVISTFLWFFLVNLFRVKYYIVINTKELK